MARNENEPLNLTDAAPPEDQSLPRLPEEAGPLGEMEGELRKYAGIIIAFWWVILLFVLVGAGLGAGYCFFADRVYRATCRFEMFREQRVDFSSDARRGPGPEDPLGRQVVVMKSGVLRGRVRDRLKPKWGEVLTDEQMSPSVRISRLGEADSMVDISVDAADKEYAEDFLAEMLQVFKELRREEVLDTTKKAMTNLRREQEDLARELEAAQEELSQFEKNHALKYTHTKAMYDERFLANLVQRENALKMERTMLESQLDFLDTADAATIRDALNLTMETHQDALDMTGFGNIGPGTNAENPAGDATGATASQTGDSATASAAGLKRIKWGEERSWQEQTANLLRLRAEYEDKLAIYKQDHPKMVQLQEAISSAERRLKLAGEIALKRLTGRLSAVKVQLEALQTAQRSWRQDLALTDEQRADHAKLVAKVQHLKRLYDEVYKRILDGSVENVDPLFTRLIEPIQQIDEAVWPAKMKIMSLSILAAVAAGVAVAFMLDLLDTKFLDIMSIEQQLGLPYISGVPNWGRVFKSFKGDQNRILVTRDKSDVATETYRTLRASVEYAIGDAKSYVLMLTSGDEAEGKTVTVLNLAILMAWSGKRVLLVDGDLRRGGCHRPLEIPGKPGFCEWLMGEQSDWRDVVSKTSYENLDFMPSGKYRHEVPEMLSATKLTNMAKEWREQYDLILVDSAPVGRVIDTGLLARASDGVLLVVRHGEARFADVRHSVHRLHDANLIGFCLNGIETGRRRRSYYGYSGRGYYYNRGGRYGYGYGYGYYGGYGGYGGYGQRQYGYDYQGATPAPYEATHPYERVPYGRPYEHHAYDKPYERVYDEPYGESNS